MKEIGRETSEPGTPARGRRAPHLHDGRERGGRGFAIGPGITRRGFPNAYHDAGAEGWTVNHKKIQRSWREERLRVPQRAALPQRPKLACATMGRLEPGPGRGRQRRPEEDYNYRRQHSSPGYQAPAIFAAACTHR